MRMTRLTRWVGCGRWGTSAKEALTSGYNAVFTTSAVRNHWERRFEEACVKPVFDPLAHQVRMITEGGAGGWVGRVGQ
jgi:hypothetical protein